MRIANDEAVEVYVAEQLFPTKFALLSKEIAKRYPDEIVMMKPEEYAKILDEIAVLTVVENVEEHISCRDLRNMEFTTQQIKDYFAYAVKKRCI